MAAKPTGAGAEPPKPTENRKAFPSFSRRLTTKNGPFLASLDENNVPDDVWRERMKIEFTGHRLSAHPTGFEGRGRHQPGTRSHRRAIAAAPEVPLAP